MKKIISFIILVSFNIYSINVFSQDLDLGDMLSKKGFSFKEIEQVKKGTGNYYFKGKELKKGNLTYDLSFNFLVRDNGMISLEDGFFTTKDGYLTFSFSIDNKYFSEINDFYGILLNSENFKLKSYGKINFHNMVNLSFFENKDLINDIFEKEDIEEVIVAEKNNNKINLQKISLSMGETFEIDFSGEFNLNDNKIYNGLIKYKLDENNYLTLKISEILGIDDNQGSIIINDKTIREVILE